MPFTPVSSALNILTLFLTIGSNLPIPLKIVITVIVTIKWILFFFTVFAMDVGIGKSIRFSIGVALNATIIAIALYTKMMSIVINVGVTLGLLILWYIITSFPLPARKDR